MRPTVEQCLHIEPLTSKQLQDKTRLSQTVVARRLRELGNRIIKVSNGRPPVYALTTHAFGADDNLLICMVDAYGHTTTIAILRPLAHGGFFVQAHSVDMSPLLLGEKGNGVYDDLPYFLYDLKPQGFLGRQIAIKLSKQSDMFPSNPAYWNANHIGRYLLSNGDDLPGNLIFGQQASLRLPRKLHETTPDDYPALAEDALAGEMTGSSAGGEQPKFTTYCGIQSAHVLVKFSPKGDDAIARRWKDILITEYIATQVLNHSQSTLSRPKAAITQLFKKEGRFFLESQRFDRIGKQGRMSMLSMQSIDAEFAGLGEGWIPVAIALHQKGLINSQSVGEIALLWAFGHFIYNTDMHLGNLSFAIDGNTFRLLPIYDMCSMRFAPKVGEAPPYQLHTINSSGLLSALQALPHAEWVIDEAYKLAQIFWRNVKNDKRISRELKSFLDKHHPLEGVDIR